MGDLKSLLSSLNYEEVDRVYTDVMAVMSQPVGPVWRAWTVTVEDYQSSLLLSFHGGLTVKYGSEKLTLPVKMTLPTAYPEHGPVLRLRCSNELMECDMPVVYVSEAFENVLFPPKQSWDSASSVLVDCLSLNIDDSLLEDLQEVIEAQLHNAARDGNLTVLEVLVERERERMWMEESNRHSAAGEPSPDMISIIGETIRSSLSFYSFRPTSAMYQKTALHVAVEYGQIEAVQYILSCGWDGILCCTSPSTEVMLSLISAFRQPVWQCEVKLMEKVLAYGTSWSEEYKRYPPAWLFAADTETDILPALWTLMEAGMSMQFHQDYILPEAAKNGYSLVMEALMDWDADVNYEFSISYEKYLRFATTGNLLSTMQLLLNHGAELEDVYGFKHDSALHCAQSAQAAIDLLARGSDVNASNYEHRTPMFTVTDIGAIQVLIRHGADIHATDGMGATPLHAHALHTDDDAVARIQLFLSLGLQPNTADQYGNTVLKYVACNSLDKSDRGDRVRAGIAQTLVNAGADVDARNSAGFAVLHSAVDHGYVALVEVLLSAPGVQQVNERDKWGKTVLHNAVCRNSATMVRLLLAHGADKSVVDHYGHTADHYAQSEELKALLSKRSAEEAPEGERSSKTSKP